MRLKYQDLYYKYRQKVDLLKVLKQKEDQPPASEARVLADFFAFLRAGGVKSGKQVVVVANSTELLSLFHSKAAPEDLAMIAGEIIGELERNKKANYAIVFKPFNTVLNGFFLSNFEEMTTRR